MGAPDKVKIMAKTEYIDIVDKNDVIIQKKISRQEALANNLCSRIAIVMLIDKNSHDVLIQQRSANTWFKPNAYCSSVCGYVLSGETMTEGALREMKEEMGVTQSISFLEQIYFEDTEGDAEPRPFIMGVYYAVVDKTSITPDPNEVSAYDFYTLDNALGLLNHSPEMLHTMLKPSLEILKKHWSNLTL